MRLLSLSEVSIQKRTSPGKLGIRDFEISFAFSLVLAFELTSQQNLLQEISHEITYLLRIFGQRVINFFQLLQNHGATIHNWRVRSRRGYQVVQDDAIRHDIIDLTR